MAGSRSEMKNAQGYEIEREKQTEMTLKEKVEAKSQTAAFSIRVISVRPAFPPSCFSPAFSGGVGNVVVWVLPQVKGSSSSGL
jgi:hypothetical protein